MSQLRHVLPDHGRRVGVLLLGMCLLAWSLAGCNRDPSGVGPTFPVEGTVTVNGKPLTTGMVVYHPNLAKGNQKPHEPRGQIDGEGRYKLTTVKVDGAPPGWYKIAVIASKPPNPKNPHAPPVWLLPVKFIDPQKSGLTREVVESPALDAYDLKLTTSEELRKDKAARP